MDLESVQKGRFLFGRTYGACFVTHSIPDASASGYHSVIPTEFRFSHRLFIRGARQSINLRSGGAEQRKAPSGAKENDRRWF